MAGSEAIHDPDWTRRVSLAVMAARAMSPGSAGATATTPPRGDVKSLTKKLSPPSDLFNPFMNPPCVDVEISMSPRVMAMAPASTRTAPPGGRVISPNANAGPELMSTSMCSG